MLEKPSQALMPSMEIGILPSASISSLVTTLVRQANEPAETNEQVGKFRLVTKIVSGIMGASIAAAMAGLMPGLTITMAVAFGLGALTALSNDLNVPSPRKRKTAKSALKTFGRSLKLGHWPKAHACLHPATLEKSTPKPRLISLEVMEGPGSFTTVKDFKKFWTSILQGKGAITRFPRKVLLSEPVVEGDYATANILLYVERFSRWTYLGLLLGLFPAVIIYMINRKTIPLEIKVEMFRHKSQWWLLPQAPKEAQD